MYVQVLQNIRGVIKTGALTHFVFIDSNNSAFEFFSAVVPLFLHLSFVSFTGKT